MQRKKFKTLLTPHSFMHPEDPESSKDNSVMHSKAGNILAVLMWLGKIRVAPAA